MWVVSPIMAVAIISYHSWKSGNASIYSGPKISIFNTAQSGCLKFLLETQETQEISVLLQWHGCYVNFRGLRFNT